MLLETGLTLLQIYCYCCFFLQGQITSSDRHANLVSSLDCVLQNNYTKMEKYCITKSLID